MQEKLFRVQSLVEDRNGRLAIMRWTEHAVLGAQPATAPGAVVLDPAA